MKQRPWLIWISIFGFWVLFGFIYGSQYYLGSVTNGRPAAWRPMIAWQMASWSMWSVFTVLILWMGKRFPIERPVRARRLFVHLVASTIIALVHVGFNFFISETIGPFPRHPESIWTGYLSYLTGYTHLYFFIYWAILGIGYAFTYHSKYREREVRAAQLESQLAQAQLQSLKMQLHPHFLFNTLHAIAGLVRKHDDAAAIEMIAGLSELLRYTLEHAGRQEVSLRQELEFIERYLEIQQMRFSDRLKVRMKIAPETLDACVPSLILQPLVENAISHGIAHQPVAGLIEISTRRENHSLHIDIQDDGPGLAEDWQEHQTKGIGVSNTQARLQQLYGASHHFELTNAKGGGTVATLVIPWRREVNGVQVHG